MKRILVRAPNWIGDQVQAYPFFHHLRALNPEAHITVLAAPWVQSLQFKNLLDEVIVLPVPEKKTLLAKAYAIRQAGQVLREIASKDGAWDVAYSLPNSFSSAAILRLSGARRTIGYNAEGRGFLLTDSKSWEKAQNGSRAEAWVNLLEQPGLRVADFWGEPAENELDPAKRGVVDGFDPDRAWPDHSPLETPRKPYFVIAPGSQADSRRASSTQFMTLAQQIFEKTGWIGVIVGGVSEAPIAREMIAQSKATGGLPLFDATAAGSVASLWMLFRNARLTLSNDSGLAHVSALCAYPSQGGTFILWGAGNPKHTQPLGPGKVRFVFNPVECWPCERNDCALTGQARLQCLRGLDLDALGAEIQRSITRDLERESNRDLRPLHSDSATH